MKKLLLILLTIVVLSVSLWAAIAFDHGDSFASGNSETTHTLASFTVGAGANTILVDGFCYNVETQVSTGVTYNGDALTLIDSISSAGFATAEIWYRLAPDVTTASVIGTTSTAARGFQTAVLLTGVNQSTPVGDISEAQGTTTTSSSLTLTTVVGDFVFSCLYVRNDAGDPGGLVGDKTEVEADALISTNLRGCCQYTTAVGTSTSMGWTWTTSTGWAHQAAVFNPATATVLPISVLSRRRR